ncbi:MAG: hypothetical protein U5K69_29700 [Balneolaceae bacterium]|nr:hypothetical protein [Balneolaceae bacterium]
MGGQTGLNLTGDLQKENFWKERGIDIIAVKSATRWKSPKTGKNYGT